MMAARNTESSKRNCLFCAQNLSRRAKEHVFPQWLLDELDIRDEQIQPTQMTPAGKAVSQRSHQLKDLQEGRVCSDCNHGWMSELETKAKPLLKSLFSGQIEVKDLSRTDCSLIARWAVKTAYMLNSASNYSLKIPIHHFAELYANKDPIPRHVSVFATTHDCDRDFYWFQACFWEGLLGNEILDIDQQEVFDRSYKVTVQFRRLILLVACWPFKGWRLAIEPELHHPLWPLRGPISYFWCDKPFRQPTSERTAIGFHALLRLAKPS
jgi:hypothetical protein